MIGVFIVALMAAIFAYFSINQKAKEWKLAFFILSLVLMWVTLIMSIEQLSISNQVVTSSYWNSTTNTTQFTYGNVTDTTPQQVTLASLLNPIWWLIYLMLAFAAIELLLNVIGYIQNARRK